MVHHFIFKDTETGRELVLPVTPKGYDIEHGRKANSISMQQVGDVNLPGLPVLLDTELECLLPAQAYPFLQPGAGTNPWVYLEQLEKWSDAGTVLRFVVSGTPVNAAVILDPIRYREQDGTGDLYCTIPLRGYRALEADTVQSSQTGNANRSAEAEPERFIHYFVAAQTFAAHNAYFRARQHKTILLTAGQSHAGMHCIDVQTDEEEFVRALVQMQHSVRRPEHTLPAPPPTGQPLSDREAEVLALVARGLINKQIADQLGIGLTTVISHRRNIMEKLGIRSVAGLVVYALAAGYADPDGM